MSSEPVEYKPGYSSGGLDTRPDKPPKEDLFFTNPFRDEMPTELLKRNNKFGTAGKKAFIEVNSHAVKAWPDKTVYQYDVSCPPPSLRSLADGFRRSPLDLAKRSAASSRPSGHPMRFSQGSAKVSSSTATSWHGVYLKIHVLHLASNIDRSPIDYPQGIRVEVDLDVERGRDVREDRPNKHRVRIVKAKNDKINLAIVRAYLDGKCDFDNAIVEAISETPVRTI